MPHSLLALLSVAAPPFSEILDFCATGIIYTISSFSQGFWINISFLSDKSKLLSPWVETDSPHEINAFYFAENIF